MQVITPLFKRSLIADLVLVIMGGKDTPPPQYSPTSCSPLLQSPKWGAAIEYDVPRVKPSNFAVETTNLRRDHPNSSVPASPEQQAKSPRSSSTRSDGSVSPIRQYMECIEPQTLSCAIVGDSGVGKTSLLLSYTTGSIPINHEPTIYDKFSCEYLSGAI